ncbi:MAG: hypothetical protein LIP09_01975 [Bacteroidales bacterium]|nr:hypothetical protein [Bacteroidales bacterium]
MKKSIIFSALTLALLTACDPHKEEGTLVIDQVTEAGLLEGATFSQYNDAACTEPAADGNYIKYSIPKVPAVTIFYLKADGSEFTITYGSNSGVFNYVPLRGSDPQQTLYFRYIDANQNETVASKEFTLQVAGELDPEVVLLASNSGSKKWAWDPDYNNGDGRVWGNAGNSGGDWDGSATWWGCGLIGEEYAEAAGNTFSSQMNHSGTQNTQEVTYGAHMIFNEDGTVTKYGADGAAICTSSYKVEGWTGGAQDNWVAGTLNVSASAAGDDCGILFPFYINSDGTLVTSFNISILTADKLVLTYYNNNPGEWGEATWWRFASSSDYEGMIQGTESKSWTWDPDYNNGDGRVWGNAGNSGGDWDGSATWWGCGLIGEEYAEAAGNTFASQMNHSGTGNEQEVTYGAYMTFFNDGTVAKYGADGNLICQTPYSLDGWTDGTQDNWVAGTLNVTANSAGNDNGILFPFYINSDGTLVTAFNVSILTSEKLVLTYYNNNPGEWGEATWWRFKAKE